MEEITQPIPTPAPKKSKKGLIFIIMLLIIIAGLIAALLWCLFWKDARSPVTTPTKTTTITTATGPCDGGTENTAPAGYTFYENAELGFKFAYPNEWGTVAVLVNHMGGTAGDYLSGSFSTGPSVTFGGNATNYVVSARDGILTDNPGYLKAGDAFYTVQIWKLSNGTTVEDKYALYPITEAATEKNGCNTKALITKHPLDEFYGYSFDLARVNLQPTNKFYGVNFVLKNPNDALRAQVDKLLQSFQLIP